MTTNDVAFVIDVPIEIVADSIASTHQVRLPDGVKLSYRLWGMVAQCGKLFMRFWVSQ